MLTFVVSLTCGSCQAVLRYENERPDWKTYDFRVEESDECEKSARFVSEYADLPLPPEVETWPEWEAAGRPRYIGADYGDGVVRRFGEWFMVRDARLALDIPCPYRYVDCPVCDARVREPKGKWTR